VWTEGNDLLDRSDIQGLLWKSHPEKYEAYILKILHSTVYPVVSNTEIEPANCAFGS